MRDNPDCFHCGAPSPSEESYSIIIEGEKKATCCPGCQAAANFIIDSGLSQFYSYRTAESPNPDSIPESVQDKLSVYDHEDMQHLFVHALDDRELKETVLVIEGMTCAACAWLIERRLTQLSGVTNVKLNFSTHRLILNWNANQIKLSQVMQVIYNLGYACQPYQADAEQQAQEKENKVYLRKLIVAGLGTMQIMMLAVALYFGEHSGIKTEHEQFIRWISWLLCTPVVIYSAKSFFISAWRDLRHNQAGMDVPIAIAIGLSYFASAWATLTGQGDVYFESAAMFTFFLLISRYLEFLARRQSGQAGNVLLSTLPPSAEKITSNGSEWVPANTLQAGDIIRVKPGDTIAVDGIITQGDSSVDESMLTGEFMPKPKSTGDTVLCGSINVEQAIQIKTQRTGQHSTLSTIMRLLERAQQDKPKLAAIANLAARRFITFVLLLCIAVFFTWQHIDSNQALWVALSVLVISCPCALSLAIPSAIVTSTQTLKRYGLLLTKGHCLEQLAKAQQVIFDKTGTLTEGQMHVEQIHALNQESHQTLIQIAESLESHINHPIAEAFQRAAIHLDTPSLTSYDVCNVIGQGVSGQIGEHNYRLGKPSFALQNNSCPTPQSLVSPHNNESLGIWVLLSKDAEAVAWFKLSDKVRAQSSITIEQLSQLKLQHHIISGDTQNNAEQLGKQLDIKHVYGDMSPENKLSYLQKLQSQHQTCVVVGDGLNDLPVLAAADISIAMSSGSDLLKTNGDAILLNNKLSLIAAAIQHARRTQHIIQQNIAWAIVYNILALPIAACGWITPWMAALGMSLSSIIVVLNTMRLRTLKSF